MGNWLRAVSWTLLWGLALAALPARAGLTIRADFTAQGVEANDFASAISTSADGRLVAFQSSADNLVPDDANSHDDVFVLDRQANTIERISTGWLGGDADGDSESPCISADGRYVAFSSTADDLVFGDNNGVRDIFVRDRQADTTTVVSVGAFGFTADGDSDSPRISADGRFVVFSSVADNLALSDTNGAQDIFLRDRLTGTLTLVSVDNAGNLGNADSLSPCISGDGLFIAYSSDADNLVADDTNTCRDVFVFDRVHQTVVRASVSNSEAEADGDSDSPSLSEDGTSVAFASVATNLVTADRNTCQDVFVRDLSHGSTKRESISSAGQEGNGDSTTPSLSADGRFIAFASLADNLVTTDTNACQDIFVRDRVEAQIARVSIAVDGTQGDGESSAPVITADGREAAFLSVATNLVANDTNGCTDPFVHQWITFSDVPPEFSAFRQIEAIVAADIARGYSDGTFGPLSPVTRAQMATFLARALAGGDGNVPAGPATPTFTDVPTSFWAYRHIEYLAKEGVVQGYSNGKFAPSVTLNRAQMAVFLARALAGGDGSVPPGPVKPTFPDVPTDYWAYRHIEYLVGRGIVHGFSDGKYHPDMLVSRAQMAIFLTQSFALTFPGG